MHGLVNRTLQNFLRDTQGADIWLAIAERAGLDPAGFEAMLHYPDDATTALLEAVESVLGEPRDAVLEDVGTYLVSHPGNERFRRLLRLTGADFTEFLYALEDLPQRIRLAVTDLHLPDLSLREKGAGEYLLICGTGLPGMLSVLTGLLRAMADDYGTLVFLTRHGASTVTVRVVEPSFAPARDFQLVLGVGSDVARGAA